MMEIQTALLNQRKQAKIRKHYDSEMERWISELSKTVHSAEISSKTALEGMYISFLVFFT
jgi:hypothetical protein